MKFGAWVPCHKCGYSPESNEERARAILLSDHNLTGEQLEEVSEKIGLGIVPTFDEAAIAQMASEFEEISKHPPPGARGCLIMKCILIGIPIALGIAIAWMLWYLKHSP
jgi:hypothetical protein